MEMLRTCAHINLIFYSYTPDIDHLYTIYVHPVTFKSESLVRREAAKETDGKKE